MVLPGLLALLEKPATQFAVSTFVVFGVQRLVPTFKPDWYKALKKPKWTPPNYVFPLMWIPLKLMQSAALALTWRAGVAAGPAATMKLGTALGTFGLHMFLGNWWNVVFFGRHQMKESLAWMYTFWLSVAGSAAAFYPLSQPAAYLMLPTLAWVTVAAKLNKDIVDLNTQQQDSKKE